MSAFKSDVVMQSTGNGIKKQHFVSTKDAKLFRDTINSSQMVAKSVKTSEEKLITVNPARVLRNVNLTDDTNTNITVHRRSSV